MKSSKYEASARGIEPPRESEVSFDATLREEGSFSDGDRKFGQVPRVNREPHAAGTAAGLMPARRLLGWHLGGVAGKRKEIALGSRMRFSIEICETIL
jgi:hypothetical protein